LETRTKTGRNFAMDEMRTLLEKAQDQFQRLQQEFSLAITLKHEEQQHEAESHESIEKHTEQEDDSRKKESGIQERKELGKEETEESENGEQQSSIPQPLLREAKSRRPQVINPQRRLELFQKPPTTLRGVLENYSVTELALNNWLRKRPILISENQTIEKALSRINAHEVHSLPVVNENKDVIGLIDVIDLATAIAQSLRENSFPLKVRNDLMMKTVGSLFLQKHTRNYVISNNTSLWQAAEQLVHTQQERFLIVNRDSFIVEPQTHPESRIDGLLTASDVIRFLTQNILLLRKEPIFLKSLQELGLPSRSPKTCLLTDNVGKVFTEMGEEKIDGVAVVDSEGKLKSNLSTSDLRSLTRKNVSILNTSVQNFLLRNRKNGWWVKPIVVTPEESLIACVLQFVCTKCHRVYFVDDKFKPVGEFNIMDIIKELIKINN